jgi:hypothetical protein
VAAVDGVYELIERYDRAQGEVVKGNPEPALRLFSHREDVTLANPLAPPVRGWEQVAEVAERAASQLRDGEMVAFENLAKHVTPGLLTLCGWSGPGPSLAEVKMSPQSLCELR